MSLFEKLQLMLFLKKRQGDVISPKLFTNALEDIFKTLHWKGRGVNIDGKFLSHLRFANHIVIVAETVQDL